MRDIMPSENSEWAAWFNWVLPELKKHPKMQECVKNVFIEIVSFIGYYHVVIMVYSIDQCCLIVLQHSDPAIEFAISFPAVTPNRIRSLFIERRRLCEQFRRIGSSVWVVHVPDLSSVVENNIRSTDSAMASPPIQEALLSEYKRGSSDTTRAVAGAFKMTHLATRYVLIYCRVF